MYRPSALLLVALQTLIIGLGALSFAGRVGLQQGTSEGLYSDSKYVVVCFLVFTVKATNANQAMKSGCCHALCGVHDT